MDEIITELFQILEDRKSNPQEGSYTSFLFNSGEDEIVKKIGEEAIEIILAAKSQGNQRLKEETADLLYHLFVLLVYRDLSWEDILNELETRRR